MVGGEESEKNCKSRYVDLEKNRAVEVVIPWLQYAMRRAQIGHKSVQDSIDFALDLSLHHISQIRTTSSAHLLLITEALHDMKTEYTAYENVVLGKIKDGISLSVSNPAVASGVAVGLGLFGFKRSRHFLYNKTVRLFVSDETLLSRADAKVSELRQTFDHLKVESEKLEKRTLFAEEEMKRGRTKLRQAGHQIQDAIKTACKIERQAAGLKDVLEELPRLEASRFRSQVSKLKGEVRKEKNSMGKKVTKISNYGIAV